MNIGMFIILTASAAAAVIAAAVTAAARRRGARQRAEEEPALRDVYTRYLAAVQQQTRRRLAQAPPDQQWLDSLKQRDVRHWRFGVIERAGAWRIGRLRPAALLYVILVGMVLCGGGLLMTRDRSSEPGIPVTAAGSWRGPLIRHITSGARSGDVQIWLPAGSQTARVQYPKWGCTGQLRLQKATPNEMNFDLHITSGPCQPGRVQLQLDNGDLFYTWSAGDDTVSGTLRRHECG